MEILVWEGTSCIDHEKKVDVREIFPFTGDALGWNLSLYFALLFETS